jgi:hypothetical protein
VPVGDMTASVPKPKFVLAVPLLARSDKLLAAAKNPEPDT